MGASIRLFSSDLFGSLRVTEIDGKELFAAVDVANALGYAKPRNAIKAHCPHALKRGVGVNTGMKADGSDAIQTVEMQFVPEGDVYRLIIASKLPAAERYEQWVMDEVLPAMRTKGGYVADIDQFVAAYFENASEALRTEVSSLLKKAEDNESVFLENQKKQSLALSFMRATEAAESDMTVNEFAKALKGKGVDIGCGRLYWWMRQNDYLQKNKDVPYQRFIDGGLFHISQSVSTSASHQVNRTLMITPKGQAELASKICG